VSASNVSKTINEANFDSVDVAIEFTQPDCAVANIITLAQKKIPTVTGTTGWHADMEKVRNAVEKAGSALLWASNFSIGVNMFYRIAWYAAELVNNFPEYDAGGFESHHNQKMDSPSGTARILAEGVLSKLERKNRIVWETINRKPEPDELHFPSLRVGNVPGTHSLFFDSMADTIEITHTARSREGFASGAVRAALWLVEAGRKGIFTIDDMMRFL
jgi:4-hydroxy-tetrahydrodipicolinate reductase